MSANDDANPSTRAEPAADAFARHCVPAPDPLAPPTFADIEAAAARISGICVETPLVISPALDARAGGRVLVKAEGLQLTGSFKMRGAFNRLAQLTPEERRRGVIAYSSGNHAQSVAAAARLVGTRATIVMPADAPALKIERTRALGAELVLYDRYREDRLAITEALARERGLAIVPPYEDARIIAGAGTLGREVARQATALGLKLEVFLAPCSGGGLIAGCATALAAVSPETLVYAVEPEDFDDTRRSLAAGERVQNDPAARSICDALLVSTPGALTFGINKRLLAGALAVSDAAVREAVDFARRELALAVEPGGAVALAAVLAGAPEVRGRTVALVLSGSNA